MNLISEAEKADYRSAFLDMHESFGRPITVWKTAERAVVASEASYNFVYDTNVTSETIPLSGQFLARIQWDNPTKEALGEVPDYIRAKIRGNFCRLKVLPDCWEFISGYDKVVIDGRNCFLVGTARPHGIVDNQFLSIYFVESN